jgi:hypothetical protein
MSFERVDAWAYNVPLHQHFRWLTVTWSIHMNYRGFKIVNRGQSVYILNPMSNLKRKVKSQHAAKWRITRATNLSVKIVGLV